MKARDSPPPVHVHVPETTPVHVHRRRRRRSPKTLQTRTKEAQVKGDGGSLRTRTPWIPPGRASTRRDVYKWQDAEERNGCCEKRGSKIDRLMMDAESANTESQHQAECVISLQRDEEELVAASKSLSGRDQDSGRRFLKKAYPGAHHRETDLLLRALVEAEIDSVAVTNQLTALKQTTDGLAKDKRLSKMDAASLGRQQELLFEKMEVFDVTNHGLRGLLRERREYEKESLVSSEQKDALRKRMVDIEAENIRLLAKLTSKEKEASKLAEHLDLEKDNVKTTEELSKILESTRDHLESELHRKEAEKSHLAAQLQRMQQSHSHQREEIQALQEQLQQGEEDRERRGLEAAAPWTQRAERAEETARQLAAQLQEKESQLAQALSTSSDRCSRHSKEVAAKGQLEEEITRLQNQVTGLSTQLQTVEEKRRTDREQLLDQLHRLSTDNASAKLDNQRLTVSLTSTEETIRGVQSEARRLKASVRKHESLVDKYKAQVQQARLESEEHRSKLDVAQKEAREAKASLDREAEQVRRQLLGRLRELEPLPEMLRRAELQLREARGEADAQERRRAEQNSALSEVRHKVEQQGARLETFQQKNLLLQEENNVLKEKTECLERKLEEMNFENKDMSQVIASKEATIRSLQQQLEDRASECSVLSRQLEQTLDDTKRQVDDSMQMVLAKQRASQSKALDLESQLSIAKTERAQLHRSKEEMERRFQCQLKNMKDRLEQSDSTNRSLQNYVHFLKTSYGNVLSDSLLAS